MMFLRGHADDGTRYEISDPLASRLKALAASAHGEPQALMDALLSVREVFPADLAAVPEFRTALRHALQLLHENGARGAIAASQ
jgi:fructuronate reductase